MARWFVVIYCVVSLYAFCRDSYNNYSADITTRISANTILYDIREVYTYIIGMHMFVNTFLLAIIWNM